MVQSEGKPCSINVFGKNSTNMAAHLRRQHKEAFAQFEEMDKAKADKRGQKRKWSSADNKQDQTLQDCIQRKSTYWPQDSTEHKRQQLSIMNMIVETNSPLHLLNHEAFQDMIHTLNLKFRLAGEPSFLH